MQRVKELIEDRTFDVQMFNQLVRSDCTLFVESRNHVVEPRV